jgi:hypothetical protein
MDGADRFMFYAVLFVFALIVGGFLLALYLG